ncbi:MAG TPA: carbohydrate ABC transporter permease [Candidatus Limnocylindrales bacterium]|nr:carbohydrate ABC transporter permease [Candidatus Limnocylindrales bacterium]
MTGATVPRGQVPAPVNRRPIRPRRIALHAFLLFMAATWLFPLLWAAFSSLRPYGETLRKGFISWPDVLSFANYPAAWTRGEFPQFYLNALIVTIPGVILTLFIASMVAFAVSRFTWRFNLFCLVLFTAGNLLPPQVIIVPLYRLYLLLPIPPPLSDNGLLYDQYFGIILIHVAFQVGFCVFVLSNYMKTISRELTEAALADGAGVWRIYWNVILPLCRPALAALATLEFTFIYNDFFWALLLMKSGDRRPITSALNNLQGQFVTDFNVLAAGALLAAIPTILVYFALQRHFISGLTLGATKG